MPTAASPRREAPAYAIAAACGMAIWFAASMLSRRQEAWDSDLYWVAGYPAAMVLCAALGFFFPRSTWRWALTLFLSQYAAMAILAGGLGSLWPVGLTLLAALSLPGMLAARGGAGLRTLLRPGEQPD